MRPSCPPPQRLNVVRKVVALLPIALAGCAAPLQNGDTFVAKGMLARLEAMCRYKNAASAKQVSELCGGGAPQAKVTILADSDCTHGECTAGDFAIENGYVRYVVAGGSRTVLGAQVPGGSVIRASLKDPRMTAPLAAVVPAAALAGRALHFDAKGAVANVGDDGTASLELSAIGARRVVLRFELDGQGIGLVITTAADAAKGDGTAPLLEDRVVLPAEPEIGGSSLAWTVSGERGSAAYVSLAKVEGHERSGAGRDRSWHLPGLRRSGKLSWARALVVTEGGSLAPTVAAAKLLGRETGELDVALEVDWASPPKGARLVLTAESGREVWQPLRTGRVRLELPLGAWHVTVRAEGHRAETVPMRVVGGDLVPLARVPLEAVPATSGGDD